MSFELKAPAKILLVVVGAGLLAYAAKRYGPGLSRSGGPASAAGVGSRSDAVPLPFLYTTEKERWLKAALEAFAAAHPEIRVEAKPTGSIDGVRAIAEERERPVVFSPADEVAVNLLESEWSAAKGSSIVDRGEMAPQPLVLTPLVVILWEERAKALAKVGSVTDWKTVHAVATDPKGWLGAGGPADWGFVKLGHTAPNRSNSGLQTLLLMAYGYRGKSSGLKPEDILDPAFQKWLKELETAVGKFGDSSGTYMRDMILFGPSKYDMIWNYENVAIGDMSAAQGRWGDLRVVYPKPTLWSNHPFVTLKGPWVSDAQRAAARTLREFLLSAEVQRKALDLGFRPGNPDVNVRTSDPQNPWNRLERFGVKVDVPPAAETPPGEVTRLLLETWRRLMAAGQ